MLSRLRQAGGGSEVKGYGVLAWEQGVGNSVAGSPSPSGIGACLAKHGKCNYGQHARFAVGGRGSDEPRWTGDRTRSEDQDDEHHDDGDRGDRPGGDVHATGAATLRSPLRGLGRTLVVHDSLPFASSVTRCAAPSMGAGTHFAGAPAPRRSLGGGSAAPPRPVPMLSPRPAAFPMSPTSFSSRCPKRSVTSS